MADNNSLGMMATCRECGGQNERTGRRQQQRLTGLSDGPDGGEVIVEEELICKQCGRHIWNQLGADAAPPR